MASKPYLQCFGKQWWMSSSIYAISKVHGSECVLMLTCFQIEDPTDPSDRDNTKDKEEFQHFKREINQKVFKILFAPLRKRSWHGETLQCGDQEVRVLYPSVCIVSLDLEEAWSFCACRSGPANHPCPKCLVHRNNLHALSLTPLLRTSGSMQSVVSKARKENKTKRGNSVESWSTQCWCMCFLWLLFW